MGSDIKNNIINILGFYDVRYEIKESQIKKWFNVILYNENKNYSIYVEDIDDLKVLYQYVDGNYKEIGYGKFNEYHTAKYKLNRSAVIAERSGHLCWSDQV